MPDKTARLQGEEVYDALKKIVDDWQHAKINGQTIDAFSASGMVQVADSLNSRNRERFLSMPIQKMHSMTFRLMKQGSDTNRSTLIHKAASLPAGNPERKRILAALKKPKAT